MFLWQNNFILLKLETRQVLTILPSFKPYDSILLASFQKYLLCFFFLFCSLSHRPFCIGSLSKRQAVIVKLVQKRYQLSMFLCITEIRRSLAYVAFQGFVWLQQSQIISDRFLRGKQPRRLFFTRLMLHNVSQSLHRTWWRGRVLGELGTQLKRVR